MTDNSGLNEAAGSFEFDRPAIRGKAVNPPAKKPGALGVIYNARQEIVVQSARDEGQTHELDIRDEDLIEIETEDGATLWYRRDELEEVFGTEITRDDGRPLLPSVCGLPAAVSGVSWPGLSVHCGLSMSISQARPPNPSQRSLRAMATNNMVFSGSAKKVSSRSDQTPTTQEP